MGCISSKGLTKSRRSVNVGKDCCSGHQSQREGPRTPERLIAVVGYTGSGMSQFIHDVAGSYQHGVGAAESVSQTTKEIQKVEAKVGGRKVTFIDTPGFGGDLARDETAVFRELSVWLSTNYGSGAKLAGIVYMQNITNDALYQPGCKFKIGDVHPYLKISCGPDWPAKTVLVCSHWDEEEGSEVKENKLKEGYWRSMTQRGSHMRRFGPPGNFEQTQTILSSII